MKTNVQIHSPVMGIVSLLFFVGGARCQTNIQSKFLAEKALCDVEERLTRGCSNNVGNIRSATECVSLCGRDKSCIGASLDENGSCFHHRECPLVSGCTVENGNHRYLTKYCAHGTWDPSAQACECVDGFYGDRCQRCFSRCRDLPGAGYGTGHYYVYIDPGQKGAPFPVTCDVGLNGWTSAKVFQNTGTFNFNKTWSEYVNGFYIGDSFWMGLYAFHRLTSAGCNDILLYIRFHSRSEAVISQTYIPIFVSDEKNNFKFTVQNPGVFLNGNYPHGSYFGDCLSPLQNISFSTWDVDNDGDESENCAARAGSGWWYDGCDNPCNMLGFGPQYLDILPRYQVVSLLGLDMSIISSEKSTMIGYLSKC